MDWISINTGCFATSNAISKTSTAVAGFVREVRESRSELDGVSCELHSLDGVLDLLKDDAAAFPPELARLTPRVLEHCAAIVDELGGYIAILNGRVLSNLDKKSRWMATRKHMGKLALTLEGYKATLGLALDLVDLTKVPVDSTKEKVVDRLANSLEVHKDVSRVGSELGRLTTKLQGEYRKNGALYSLRGYLDALQAHATAFGIDTKNSRTASSFDSGETPDSAIEMEDPPVFPAFKTRDVSLPIEEIDELLDELNEIPNRPPTPPPKALARRNSSRSSVVSPTFDGRLNVPDTEYVPVTRLSLDGEPEIPGRHSSLRPFDIRPSTSHLRPSTSHQRTESLFTRPSADTLSLASTRTSRVGRLFGHMRNAFSENHKGILSTDLRPSTPSDAGSIIRSGSRRISGTFKRMPLFKTEDPEPEVPEPDTIFGVSLKKSMQIAGAAAKTHHSGSGSSRRDFPRCMLACYSFIKENGTDAPHIFGEPGEPEKLQALKDVFSTPPTYGENIEWNKFSVYEAADLILMFLAQLPKPLVSESVAKRWISLSKQATMPGSHAIRLEQCIDFWEEALGGIRGSSRSLFKLLLNLWGEIADAADRNDMTAERLSGRVLKPLMHTPPGRYDTDFMLGLAFLIRKRSEYTMLLRGDTRKSNAAFEG